jgi:hypothetical protein
VSNVFSIFEGCIYPVQAGKWKWISSSIAYRMLLRLHRVSINIINISTYHRHIARMNILLFETLENRHLHSRCKSKV